MHCSCFATRKPNTTRMYVGSPGIVSFCSWNVVIHSDYGSCHHRNIIIMVCTCEPPASHYILSARRNYHLSSIHATFLQSRSPYKSIRCRRNRPRLGPTLELTKVLRVFFFAIFQSALNVIHIQKIRLDARACIV